MSTPLSTIDTIDQGHGRGMIADGNGRFSESHHSHSTTVGGEKRRVSFDDNDRVLLIGSSVDRRNSGSSGSQERRLCLNFECNEVRRQRSQTL